MPNNTTQNQWDFHFQAVGGVNTTATTATTATIQNSIENELVEERELIRQIQNIQNAERARMMARQTMIEQQPNIALNPRHFDFDFEFPTDSTPKKPTRSGKDFEKVLKQSYE